MQAHRAPAVESVVDRSLGKLIMMRVRSARLLLLLLQGSLHAHTVLNLVLPASHSLRCLRLACCDFVTDAFVAAISQHLVNLEGGPLHAS